MDKAYGMFNATEQSAIVTFQLCEVGNVHHCCMCGMDLTYNVSISPCLYDPLFYTLYYYNINADIHGLREAMLCRYLDGFDSLPTAE